MSFLVRRLTRHLRAVLAALIALPLLAAPRLMSAQTGSLGGLVSDSAKLPVPGVQVVVVGTRFGVTTGLDGRYMIVGIPAGSYTVRLQRLGSKAQTFDNTAITAGNVTTLNATMSATALQLGSYVISASRRVEKLTDAPATISRIDADMIKNSVGNSFTGALKEVRGVDFIQTGVAAAGINARGFNSAFNNRMLQMEDNRIAVLPENGLPVGVFTTIPKVDLAGVEVLIGPGAALYGPDASNGVVTLQSKDPKQYQGMTIETTAGSNGGGISRYLRPNSGTVSYFDVQGRYAGMIGKNIGYKVAAEKLTAQDWTNVNKYAPVAPRTDPSAELNPDFSTHYLRGSGALVYYFDDGGRLEYQGGASKSSGIGITSVGRNQLIDWGYWNQQVRYTATHWFAQAYATRSLSGKTYAMNGFSTNRLSARFANASDDSVQKASAFPADGRMQAAEVQYNNTIPQFYNTRVIGGIQYRHDDVSSHKVWLTDALTGKNITQKQIGVYGQTETQVNENTKLIFGARVDHPDFYKTQFSPKAALVVNATDNATFRLTFNRAFKSPTVLNTSFYYRDFQPGIGVFGNKDGTITKKADGTVVATYDKVVPEVNNTIEIGYKGVVKERLYVDIAGYSAKYKSFISPLVVVGVPALGTYAYNAATNTKYVNATGADQTALTYYNLGAATISGIDAGFRYIVNDNITWSGTASFLKLDSIIPKPGTTITGLGEASALNSPTVKATTGLEASKLIGESFGGFTMRYVKDYQFLSGVHNGRIPGVATIDFHVGYRIPGSGAVLNFSMQNFFSCTSGKTFPNTYLAAALPAIYNRGWGCGLGRKHVEILDMPSLGSMAFLGIRFDR